jgi:hypothetical protein
MAVPEFLSARKGASLTNQSAQSVILVVRSFKVETENPYLIQSQKSSIIMPHFVLLVLFTASF